MGRDPELVAGGRAVPEAFDRIRRYSGRTWSGGPGVEVWAWAYYDLVPTPHDNRITAIDVLAASALHPGISRTDLTFFVRHSDELADWLAPLPTSRSLYSADGDTIDHLATLAEFEPHISISLLSKVLHRKRPRLIPLVDRHVLDWFGPITRERTAARAWEPLLHAMREDADHEREIALSVFLQEFRVAARPDRIGTEASLGLLRATDIAIWMGFQ